MAAKSRNLCVLGSSFTQGGRVAAPCCCRWGAGALVPVGEHCGTHWTHFLEICLVTSLERRSTNFGFSSIYIHEGNCCFLLFT